VTRLKSCIESGESLTFILTVRAEMASYAVDGINLLALELDIHSSAHHLCKM